MLLFVPTPIGNLADISLRALESLNDCEIVLCEDTRVTKKLLTLLSQKQIVKQFFPKIDIANKIFISLHSHNQEEFLKNMDTNIFSKNVVYCVDAGMPCISDPGALLLQYAKKNNIDYEILPGSSAFNQAFVNSALIGGFCFFGFLAPKKEKRIKELKSLQKTSLDFHIIIYESPSRLRDSLKDINQILPDSTLYVYKELTKMHQNEYVGNAAYILKQLPDKIQGEYCIIISKTMDTNKTICLNQKDILSLDMHIKQKSKLLSQVSTKGTKEWYSILSKRENI